MLPLIAYGLHPIESKESPSAWKKSPCLREPIGAVIDSTIRPNGLRIDKIRVPLGVVFLYL